MLMLINNKTSMHLQVRSPNDVNKLGSSYLSSLPTLPVLRVLFWCVFWLFLSSQPPHHPNWPSLAKS